MVERNKFEFDADFSKLLAGQKKLLRAVATTGLGYDKMGRKSGMAGDKSASSASKATSKVMGWASSFVGVGAAIGVATKALTALNAERNRGADKLLQEVDAIKELAQIATKKVPLDSLIAQFGKLSSQTGIPRTEAAKIIFQAQSVGKPEIIPGLARKISPSVPSGDISSLLQAAFTIQQNAPQFSMEQIINMMGVGAQASKLSLSQFGAPTAQAIPMALRSQREAFRLEETLATVSAVSGPTVSAEDAVTRLKAFQKGISKTELAGLPIIETIKGAQQLSTEFERLTESLRKLDPKSAEFKQVTKELAPLKKPFQEIFGRAESQLFFEVAKQPHIQDAIIKQTSALIAASVATGTPSAFIQTQAGEVAKSKFLPRAIESQKKDEALAGAELSAFSTERLRRRNVIKDFKKRSIDRGQSGAARFNKAAALETLNFLGIEPETRRSLFEELAPRQLRRALGAEGAIGDPGLAGPAGNFNAGPGDDQPISETQRRLMMGVGLPFGDQQFANILAKEDKSGGGIRSQILADTGLRKRISRVGAGLKSRRFVHKRGGVLGLLDERTARMSKGDDRDTLGGFQDLRAIHSRLSPEFDPDFLSDRPSRSGSHAGLNRLRLENDESLTVDQISGPIMGGEFPSRSERLLQQQTEIMENQQSDQTHNLLRGVS